jgi:predicted aconitase
MSAALAASGGIAMFHIRGVTPEARGQALAGLERVGIGRREMEEARLRLTGGGEPGPGVHRVPPLQHRRAGRHSEAREGAQVSEGKGLWVWTSRGVYARAKRRGYVGAIEAAGGRVFTETCMVVCPLEESGYRHMITNSCKAAHYVPSTTKLKATVADLHAAVGSVMEG